MWRSIVSRSSPVVNRSSFFPRLLLSCLGNQTSTTTSEVIHKSIDSSSSSSSWSQYHSLVSRQHQPYQNQNQNQRFMFKYYSCPACDTVEKGRKIIEEQEAKDLEDEDEEVSEEEFNEMIRVDEETWDKVMSLFDSDSIESILESPDNWDLLLNSKVFMRLVTDYPDVIPEDHLIRYFKWALSRDDFTLPYLPFSATVWFFTMMYKDMPDGRDFLYLLWNLVKRLRAKDSDIVYPKELHRLLDEFTQISDSAVAVEILDSFEEFQCVPHFDSLWGTAMFCGTKSDRDEPWESRLCQKIIDNLRTGNVDEDRDRCFWSINMYARHRPNLAHAIYIVAKDITPRKSLHHLIRSLSKRDDTVCLALDVLADLSCDQQARNNSTVVFSCVVSGLCRKGDIEGAKKLMAEMILKGPPPGTKAFNDIIKSLCVNGDLEHALEMLTLMESRGLKPNVDTYRGLIRGYEKRGLMDQAAKVLSMAKNKHPTCKMSLTKLQG